MNDRGSDERGNEGSRSSSGSWSTISYISNNHLKSADFFVQQAECIENKYPNRESLPRSGDMSYHAYVSYSTSAIINSVAFLEATINEIQSKMKRMGEQSYPAIEEEFLWKVMDSPLVEELFGRQTATIEKYNNMLSIANENEISTGKDPGQSVEAIRELRNAFVHYTPEDVEISGKSQTNGEFGFETGLQGRFELNPYTGDGNPFFPDQCQSRGCAEWAVKKSLSFAESFCSRLGIDRPYEPMLEYIEIKPV